MRVFFFIIFLSLSAKAHEEVFPVYYFNPQALQEVTTQNPRYAEGRLLLKEEDRNWLKPLLALFPRTVWALDELHYRSDDNCTLSPDRALGVEVWQACRRHDYCQSTLADYRIHKDFKEAFKTCNLEFKNNVDKLCQDNGSPACVELRQLYYWGVSIFPQAYRTFISTQNKQALFLSEVLRTQSEQVPHFLKISEARKKLEAFCKNNETFLSTTRSQKWKMYTQSQHDHVPHIQFLPCEDFQGTQIVSSPHSL
jgi:hypothetical protein